MTEQTDDLEGYIAARAASSPDFPALVDGYLTNRELMTGLAERRAELGLSQREMAARMGTSQAAVARFERGEVDPKLSTIQRYAVALGQRVDWRLVSGHHEECRTPSGTPAGAGWIRQA